MKKPLFFVVLLWSLLCAGMTLWAIAPAHGQTPRNGEGAAYVTDTAYAVPRTERLAPSPAMQARSVPSAVALAKPWEGDPRYQEELNMLIRESALRQRQYRERAQAEMSRLDAQRVNNLNSHLSSVERLGQRKNTHYTEYTTLASRHNAREADIRARMSQVRMTLETNQLREQHDLSRRIRALDDSYARREPYRSQSAGR